MLYQELKTLYEKVRLKNYRDLFSRVKERDGSLSATEAYAADVIYLLGNPTVSTFAETLGTPPIRSTIWRPRATRCAPPPTRTGGSAVCPWGSGSTLIMIRIIPLSPGAWSS